MSRAGGFTLLETMVALALLGLTVVALLQLVAGATEGTTRSRGYTVGMALAEQEMERLLATGPRAADRLPDMTRAFPVPFEAYRYRVGTAAVPGRDLLEITVRVTWEIGGGGAVDLATRVAARGTGDRAP